MILYKLPIGFIVGKRLELHDGRVHGGVCLGAVGVLVHLAHGQDVVPLVVFDNVEHLA